MFSYIDVKFSSYVLIGLAQILSFSQKKKKKTHYTEHFTELSCGVFFFGQFVWAFSFGLIVV